MTVESPHMKDQLAKAAFELFAERGVRGVTLDAVSRRAGVSKGSLYWHYRSKREVILAAANFYYRDWLLKANAAAAATTDALEKIRRVWRMSVETCLFDRTRRVFSTEIFALSLHDAEVRRSWSQFYDAVFELFAGLIQGAVCAGQLQIADPRRAADWLLAMFEGVKHRAAFKPQGSTPAEREAVVEQFMEVLAALSLSGAPAAR